MEGSTYAKLWKKREQKWFASGGGMWFRNSDGLPCFVHIEFYPKTQAYMVEDWKLGAEFEIENSRKVTLKELEENYHRIRL